MKCSEVLQCNDGTSNKVSNIIRRHRIQTTGSCCFYVFCYYHILSYSIGSFFYKYMVVIYVFLLEKAMYSYRCLCIHTVVYVFLDAATLTEVFPCFFLSCKANARV